MSLLMPIPPLPADSFPSVGQIQPYPSSLMIGCFGQMEGASVIRTDLDNELEGDVPSATIRIPYPAVLTVSLPPFCFAVQMLTSSRDPRSSPR